MNIDELKEHFNEYGTSNDFETNLLEHLQYQDSRIKELETKLDELLKTSNGAKNAG